MKMCEWRHIDGLQLADPKFIEPGVIVLELILGFHTLAGATKSVDKQQLKYFCTNFDRLLEFNEKKNRYRCPADHSF